MSLDNMTIIGSGTNTATGNTNQLEQMTSSNEIGKTVSLQTEDKKNEIVENEDAIGDLKVSNKAIKEMIDKINSKINEETTCEFSIHEGTNRVCIKVKDKKTNKVIKEIPPEEFLDMVQKMWEISGIMVDEKR